MFFGFLVLIALVLVGLAIRHQPLAAAALLLLAVHLGGFRRAGELLAQHSVQLGVFFLLVAVLAPFTQGGITWGHLYRSLTSPPGFLVVGVGAVASYLAARGVRLLQGEPSVMIPLVVGSVLGVSLLGGVPAGPLVAAGLAALLLEGWR